MHTALLIIFLPGEYLGLTGARLVGPEMLECGLATHFVFSKVYKIKKGFYIYIFFTKIMHIKFHN